MKFTRVFKVCDYNLADTLSSGQAFRWRAVAHGWEGVVRDRWVWLAETPAGVRAGTEQPPGDWKWLTDYLQLEVHLEEIVSTFPTDPHMEAAVQSCRGLRLLRQPPWECLASFILSSTKQIVQIQQIVAAICQCYGEQLPVPKSHAPAWSFPRCERIAAAGEAELRACKMGFRAPYLQKTARMLENGEVDLNRLPSLPLEEARTELMRLPGVGRKIADCVLLFALGFDQAFPVDVWVLKVLRERYFAKRRPSPSQLQQFTETYFGPHAGYAQQYLFHYIRTKA